MDRLGGAFDSFDGHDQLDDFVDDGDSHSNPPPSPVGQDERRMQVRAYNHWASLLGNNRLPPIEDLEPEFLGDFGPHSVLLDFSTGSSTPTIQFIGDALSRECGLYEDIESLTEVPPSSLLSQIADNYLKVVSEQAPTGFEAEFVNAKGATVLYRGILLPYSSDTDTLDFVYAVINWKEVADAQTADALLQQFDEVFEAEAEAVEAPVAEDQPLYNPAPLRKRNPLRLSDFEAPAAELPEIHEVPAAASFEPEAFEDYPAPVETPVPAGRNRAVDALGNPIGGAAHDDADEGEAPAYSSGPMTAADYGLPEWDEEEVDEDDVDEVVNPLADIDLNSRLLSLVNPQARNKKSLSLHGEDDVADEPEAQAQDTVDDSYFAAEEAEVDVDPAPLAEAGEAAEAWDHAAGGFEEEVYETAELPVAQSWEVEAPVEEAAVEEAEVYELQDAEEDYPVEAEYPVEDEVEAELDCPLEAEAVEAVVADEPFELTDELVELTEEAADDFGQDFAEDDYAAVEEAAEEPVVDEPQIVLEPPVAVVEWPEETVEQAEDVFELADELVAEAEVEEEAAFDTGHDAAVAEVEVEAEAEAELSGPQPISSEELEQSLEIASQLAESGAGDEADRSKALYDAVRLAYDLASYLRAEGNPAVSQAASDSIDALAGNLRELEARDLRDLSIRGPEFALVMVRRGENGELTVLGEVPEEQELVDRAARRLLGR